MYDVFSELYKIRPFIAHPHFSLRLLLLEVTDYRITSGNPKDRGERFERMPSALLEDVTLNCLADYGMFVPKELPAPFTSKDLKAVAKISLSLAQLTLLVLTDLGVVKRVGKSGNAYLYEKTDFAALRN